MIKDRSNNTRVCEPVGATQIACEDGSIESADGMIDMRIQLESDVPEVALGDSVFLTAKIENLDPFDHATNVVATIDIGSGLAYAGGPDDCSHANSVVTCIRADIEPTPPLESEDFILQANAVETGILNLNASVSADEIENFPFNDTTSLTLNGVAELPDVDLMVTMTSTVVTADVGDTAQISVTVTNSDGDTANGVQLTYSMPEGFNFIGVPSQCVETHIVVCNFGLLTAGISQTSIFDVAFTEAGTQVHSVSVTSNNEADTANNNASILVEVLDPSVITDAVDETITDTETTSDEDTESDATAGESDQTDGSDVDDSAETTDDNDADQAGVLGSNGDTDTADASDTDADESDASGAGSGIGGTTEQSAQANAGSETSSSGGGGSSGVILLLALLTMLSLSMAISVRFSSDIGQR